MRAVLALGVLTLACTQDAHVGDLPSPSTTDSGLLDILVVIDSSSSMAAEQVLVAQEIKILMDQLPAPRGGTMSVHLGVISSDMGAGPFGISGCSDTGDDGALQPGDAACNGPTDSFIEHEFGAEGSRETNYPGTLEEAFACTATLGTSGCGFEQPLAAMRRGLEQHALASATGTGFLRDDARLAVIFVTDEDDCSVHDVGIFDPDESQNDIASELGPLSSFRCVEFGLTCDGDDVRRSTADYADCVPREDSPYLVHPDVYVDYLLSLKDDRNNLVVAVIGGDRSGLSVDLDGGKPQSVSSCESQNGTAFPAIRLGYFAEQFPHHLVRSICQPTLRGPMMEVGVLIRSAIETPSS